MDGQIAAGCPAPEDKGDVKTAQGLLGHSDSPLTLDHYAQVVTELGEAAAKAMGERILRPPRDGRAMGGGEDDSDD